MTIAMPMARLVLAVMLVVAVGARAEAPLPILTQAEVAVAEAIRSAHRSVSPDDPRSWGHYGLTLDAHGFFAEAIVAYERAGRGEPDYRWFARRGALVARVSTDSAIELLRIANELDPADVAGVIDLADLLLLRGTDQDRGRARILLEDAREVALGLDEVIVTTRLAQLALADRDVERARSLIEGYAHERVPHRDIYVLLARIDSRQHEKWTALARGYPRKQARSALRETLASLDASRRAQLERVNRLIVEERIDLAASLISTLDDDHATLLVKARLARRMGNDEDADTFFDAVLRRTPGDPQALLGLVELGAREAAAAVEEAVPGSDRDARKAYATLLLRSGDAEAARDHLRGLEAEDPTDHDLSRRIASLDWDLGNTDSAEARWHALVDRFPADAQARRALVGASWWRQDQRAAIDHARRLLDIDVVSAGLFIRVVTAATVASADERRLVLELARREFAVRRRDPIARLNYAAAALVVARFGRAGRLADAFIGAHDVSLRDELLPVAVAIRDAAMDERIVPVPWPFEWIDTPAKKADAR